MYWRGKCTRLLLVLQLLLSHLCNVRQGYQTVYDHNFCSSQLCKKVQLTTSVLYYCERFSSAGHRRFGAERAVTMVTGGGSGLTTQNPTGCTCTYWNVPVLFPLHVKVRPIDLYRAGFQDKYCFLYFTLIGSNV